MLKNPYIKFRAMGIIAMLILVWPSCWLLFAIDLGWATLPALLMVAAVYGFLLAYDKAARDSIAQWKRDEEPSQCP